MTSSIKITTTVHGDGAGLSLMEAVAKTAGEPISISPKCVADQLARSGEKLCSALPPEDRQAMADLIPDLIGTAGDGKDDARGYLALDWMTRVDVPAWLDLAGRREHAQRLRDHSPIVDEDTAADVLPLVREAAETLRDRYEQGTWEVRCAAAAGKGRWKVDGYAISMAAEHIVFGHATWGRRWATFTEGGGVDTYRAAIDTATAAALSVAYDAIADLTGLDMPAMVAAAHAPLQETIAMLQRSAVELYTQMVRM